MNAKTLAAALPLVLLAACNQAAAPADPDAVMTAIHEVENGQMKAINARDAAGAGAVYAPDAMFYVPGQDPVSGSEAIAANFAEGIKDPAYAVTADEGSNRSWVAASGDMAATSFTGTWTRTVDGKVTTDRLVNQTVWQKQADGSWKIASDMNMTLPAAATAPAPAPAASEAAPAG